MRIKKQAVLTVLIFVCIIYYKVKFVIIYLYLICISLDLIDTNCNEKNQPVTDSESSSIVLWL